MPIYRPARNIFLKIQRSHTYPQTVSIFLKMESMSPWDVQTVGEGTARTVYNWLFFRIALVRVSPWMRGSITMGTNAIQKLSHKNAPHITELKTRCKQISFYKVSYFITPFNQNGIYECEYAFINGNVQCLVLKRPFKTLCSVLYRSATTLPVLNDHLRTRHSLLNQHNVILNDSNNLFSFSETRPFLPLIYSLIIEPT